MTTTGFTAEAGRQEFLQLMVTQLQYQDPLEPVGQQEFLQQLAQFSVVEGVEKLNVQFADLLRLQTLTNGAEIIGKTVEYAGPEGSGRGTVDGARIDEGRLTLEVNGQTVPIDSVQRIEGNITTPA